MSAAESGAPSYKVPSDAGSWEEVWGIFEDAAELPTGEVDVFLDRACAGRPALRHAVEDLLDADQTTQGAFFDRPVIERPDGTGAEARRPTPRALPAGVPERLGPYTLKHKVGEGGMSSVFLAVRDDDYRRQVVVKIIRPGMETEHLVQRLRIERQILAGLDHPYIARLLDGGSTPAGTPYFVMEYVDGVPVDAFCERGELSIEARLRLFLKLCSAVAFAHRNLIVHRDIKPGNILVNADGEPKLLDFGIAKLLNPDLGSPEIAPTVTATRMLTPSYASPEQILGRLVTTSSDVYSLGVLLYKLLTHTLPYDFTKRTAIEIEQLVTAGEPRKPSQVATRQSTGSGSAAVDPIRVRRQLSGDLDAVVLKALRNAPQQRYASVDALADDIERYLQGLPVEARRGSRRYRVGKFFSRHRVAVAVLTGVLSLCLYFVTALARQNTRLEDERDAARLERDQKQEVLHLFQQWVALAEPYVAPGEKLTMDEVLRRSTPIFEARLQDQPKVRAQLLHTTGSMLERLGELKTAHSQLEEALELRRLEYGEDSFEVAETRLVLAEILSHNSSYDRSLEETHRALAAVNTLRSTDRSPRVEGLRVHILNQIVAVYCHRGELEAAREFALEAMRSAQELNGSQRWIELATLDLVANWYSKLGNYTEAAGFQRRAVDLRRELFGESHPTLIVPLSNLGLDLRWSGKLDAAERVYRESLDLARDVYGTEHRRYSITLNNLAGVRYARGDYEGALESYLEVSELFRRSAGDAHWRNFFLRVNTEAARLRAGDPEQAERRLRSGLGRRQAELGEDHWLVHYARSTLGEALFVQGKVDEAEPLLRDAFERLVALEAKDRYLRRALERWSVFLEDRGRSGEIPTYTALLPKGAA